MIADRENEFKVKVTSQCGHAFRRSRRLCSEAAQAADRTHRVILGTRRSVPAQQFEPIPVSAWPPSTEPMSRPRHRRSIDFELFWQPLARVQASGDVNHGRTIRRSG